MSTSSEDVLSASKVLALAQRLAPAELENLSSPPVALALLVHALHTALSFRLVPAHASPGPALASDATEAQREQAAADANRLPAAFGQPGRDLSFNYRHSQSAMEFDIGVSKVGGRCIVNAIAVEVCRVNLLAFHSTQVSWMTG